MEIRWLRPEEYEDAFKLIRERAAWMENPQSLLLGQFEKGELVGVVGVTRPYVIEPLVMKEGVNPKSLIVAIDQRLDPNRYFFFVRDERFQGFIDRSFAENVEGWQGKLYVRGRDYGSTEGPKRGDAGIERAGSESVNGVCTEAGRQGADFTSGDGADGSGNRPADFHVQSLGAVHSWGTASGTLK